MRAAWSDGVWRECHWQMALVAAIAVAAAALRFYGLRWGLPNALHSYSYHPDEFLTVGSAFGAIYVARSFDPRFYNYPTLYIYLSALAMAVVFGYGAHVSAGTIYLIPRVVAAGMGVAAVVATYWAGRVLFDHRAGVVAALVLCVAPLHVQHSHFASVDVPSTLFVALGLGYAGLVLKRGAWRDYMLAGVMSGLAGGTKYNAVLVVLSLLAAHLLGEGRGWRRLASGRLWAAFGCAIAAFVIATPGSVLRTEAFLNGITYELRHAASGHGLVFAGTGNGFVYTLMSSLWYGLGPGLAVMVVVAGVWVAATRSKPGLVVLAFAVPYYTLISLSQVRFARYALPLFPAVALLCAWFACDLYARLPRFRSAVCTVGVLLLLLTLGYTLQLNQCFSGADPRDLAGLWVKRNVAKGAAIGVIDVPWFYSPPFTKTIGFGSLPQRLDAMRRAPYRIQLLADARRTHDLPQWAVVSDFEAADALRLRANRGLSKADRERVRSVLSDIELISRHYRVRKVFGARRCVWQGSLPHDMRYPCPTITIYERRR